MPAKVYDTKDENKQEQSLLFQEVVVFYNYVFDLGKELNPTVVARNILEHDFAVSFTNSLTGKVEFASRFKELYTLRKESMNLSDLHQQLEAKGLKGASTWVLRNPRRSLGLWRTMRKTKKDNPKPQKDEEDERDVETIVKDTITFIDEKMIKSQTLEKLHLYSDRILFSPLYLHEVPFVRVGLQPFFAQTDTEDLAIDVELFVHRTGVGIISFYVVFNKPKTISELIDLETSKQVKLNQTEVVRGIVEPQADALGVGFSKLNIAPDDIRYSSGVEWITFHHQDPVSLSDVFELYQSAVIPTALDRKPSKPSHPHSWLRTPDWFVYPVVFVRDTSPQFTTTEEFNVTHARELAGVLRKGHNYQDLRGEKIEELLSKNISSTIDHSYYIGPAHTTIMYHSAFRSKLSKQRNGRILWEDWLFNHFQVSSLIDMLLTQKWMLYILNAQMRNLPYDSVKLNQIKRSIILALDEYHRFGFNFGGIKEIVQVSQEEMGINDSYKELTERVTSMEKLIEVAESRKTYQRDLVLKLATTLLTLIFGLSGINDLVTILSGWSIRSSSNSLFELIYNAFISFVLTHPTRATIILYAILVGPVLIIMLWSLLPTRSRHYLVSFDQSKQARKPSFTWPKSIDYVSVEEAKKRKRNQ